MIGTDVAIRDISTIADIQLLYKLKKMEFDFISDQRFRVLLSRDYLELQSCIKNKTIKSTLILSGSIIEAALTDYFIQYPAQGKTATQILRSDLNTLLDLAESENVISTNEKNLATVIKDYRNLIHPGREIRKQKSFDLESAKIAGNVVNIILKSIKSIYISKYGHSAERVFERLKTDWHYHSVFDQIILKLNHQEKIKLLNYLLEFDIWEKSYWNKFENSGIIIEKELYDLQNVKSYVNKILLTLSPEDIEPYLKKLIDETEAGDVHKAYCFYNLFHEKLGQLKQHEQELIATYMLELLIGLLENIRDVAFERTYSTIGRYIKTEKAKSSFKDTMKHYITNSGSLSVNSEVEVFEQIIESLDEEFQEEYTEYLSNYFPKKSDIPVTLIKFYTEVSKRGLIKEK